MAQFRDANEAKQVLKQMQKVEQDYGAPPSGGSPSSAIQHAIDNAKRFESWQDSLSKVMQSFQSFNDEQGDRWTEDASGGTVESMRSLMKQYEDAYSESVYSFGNLENAYKALKDSVSWIDQRNSFMSQFNSQEDYDRNRSGYINYGVGYTPQNWNLTDDDARAIRTQQAKADKEAASQAKAEYEAADSAFRKINNAYAMATNNRYAGTYDEEKSKALHDEYIAAKDRVQQAKAAYDDIQNRLDAYNAGWGKVDQYADVISASKGTKGSYQGPGYEELTAWNRGRQQDMLDQQMAAFRDDAPPAQGSSPDNMPAVNDKLGFWLSLTPEQREEEVFTSGNAKHWGNLTEGEISAYYYLIQNRGQEAADKYLDDMTAELGRREDAKFIEKVENANGLALAGYNALSVAENVLGALPSAAEKAGELITGKDNPYSNVQGLQRRAQYIRGVTGQRLDDSVADSQWLQDKVGEQWANRVGNLANQTYQAMMSGVDSAAGALLFGPGAGFGVGPFTMHLGGYSTVMGMGAFAQRAQELQAMGASREQMAVGAVGAGILESIFEDISAEAFFGNVLDNPDAAFVKKLLTQMGVEASEEVCTEIGNMALDAINLGRKSDNQRRILEYVASGLSYEDAVREATRDAAMDIFWAGYGGAVSAGGMTAVGHSVSSAVSNVDAARSNYYVGSRLFESGDAGALVEQAQGLTDTKARKKLVEQAQRVQKNQAAGNDSFADKMDTGKVANRIARQAQKEGADAKRSAFQAIARDYLTGQENIGNKKLAEKVLTKAYMGDNFLPGEKGYYNILGGEKLLNAVLDSVPAGALESDMEARQQKSARTVMGTLGAVTGSKSVTEFSKTFDSRNDGMAYRKDSHDPVNIRGISRMQGGKLYLQTDSGEVLADNMIYGNYGEAKLFKVISAMDIDTAGAQKVLGMVENTQLETGDFADAMQNAYLDGYTGVEFDRINRSSLAGQLTQEQRRLAWEAGKQARAAQIGSMVQTVDSRKMATAKGGLKIADNVDLSNLNKAQESALAFIRAISESGVPVEVYASTEAERAAGAANGSFSPDGSIRIDINAGDNGQGAAAYALAHEITHFTEIYSPEKFQNLADLLIREAGENGISWENMLKAKTAQLREQKQYAGLEEQKLADLARSECIAEMCETILTDTDAAARLSRKLQSQDKSLWEKIKDFFTGLVEKLKEAYADMNPDSRIARSMKAAVTQNEAVLNAWVDAVSEGVENFNLQDGERTSSGTVTDQEGNSIEYLYSSRVVDQETLDFLNGQETVTTYKTMQLVDGKLYPPMAAIVAGSYEDYSELGKWEAATEHPELIKLDKSGKPKFTLNKGKGQGSIAAAYNPYMHSSNMVLNDQFSGAYARPNLVTVECVVPKSELTSGYRAQYAKDSTGWHSWHTGTVAGALRQQSGIERQVLLSRWIKPVRIIPNSEVAQMYKQLLTGTDISVPDNVVPPDLLKELKNAGVKISESGRVARQKNDAQEGVKFSIRNTSSMSLQDQIKAYHNGKLQSSDAFYFGEAPKTLNKIGITRPLAMSQTDYAKSAKYKHNTKRRNFLAVSSNLASPMFSFSIDGKHGIVVDDYDGDGNKLLIAIHENKISGHDNVDAIKSIYGIQNPAEWLNNQIKSGATFTLFDEKRANTFLHSYGYSASLKEGIHSTEDNVTQQAENVNGILKSSRNQTKTENFKRWFGDWQNDPANASKVVNADGTPKVLYHQTASDFTIFDPKYPGAGTRDNETPFGIFMKSSDKNIGLNGDKQMALYARIVNPLEVQDRQHLTRELEKISPDFSAISEEYRNLNEEYQRKVDDAGEAVSAYMLEWRKAHPDASRRAIYEDARYDELSDSEDALIDEWEEEAKKIEARSKEIITRDLEANGYDGVIILYDKGSFGRSTDTYIALHPEQVKSATDNIGTFDGSNPDIRYSSRTNPDTALSRLEKQNERLQEEMDYLKQLVKIQKSGNKDFILDRNSVKKHAGKLMDAVNAKGDREALSRMLNDFYHRMHTDSEITWDAMQEDAGAIADWLLEHHQAQRDEYAQNILDFLKKRRVKLSESQAGDIEYSYGSLSDFKRAIKGSIILDQSSNTSLDQLWQEAAAQFPDQFAADAVDADMPDRLADIVRWANSSESSVESEFQYNVAEYRNDLMQKVMEGYWDVEPVTSVSDKLNAKISDLRQQHKAAMQNAKDQKRQAIANERARSKAAIDAYAAQRDAIDKANKALYEAERDQMVQAYSRDMKALESQFGEDTRIMQKEFFRLLREYDKQSAKGEKTGARDTQTIQELRNQLKKEADSHKEDSAAWNREFNRLLREYDASGRQIDRLEAKVKHQQEAAKAKVESRKMTEARYKIERTAKELNRYLLHPTNTVHVPAAMQESVAKAMDALTMAISGRKGGINADRLSEYAYQLRELQKDPSGNAGKIADVQRKIQTLTERDARMQTAMADLKEQYQALQSSGDPAAAQIYDENVAAWIQDCLDVIGETEYRDMSLAQLESVQRVYRALLRRIQTANKAFREGKQATISERVGRLTMEMDVKKKKVKTSGKAEKAVDQFFWNNLKPVYAFDRIGSGVMSELYENLRSGEDTWYNDVSAAKAFFLGTAAKYGYNTWDNENLMEFVSATGQKFQLNLEERMSLYAYSLREQARDHLKKGGIVLNENTERVAVGLLGVKRNMIYNDANAYNLTDETITAIGDSLTADQRAFAREMQQYLSTTMGAKGNEISRQLYDIDLFKEQFYWPLVSSKDYSARIKDAGENPAGNKIKNMGAAKPITPGASNPVVLSGFMDTWAGHVNQMSMYHAFTLPMEDFYRVYNWNSGSNENSQTKSTVQMLKDVYGDGATNYIDQFLKDLNGGLRADPRATVGRAMLSRFKKSAVFASASVAIQQPSAIGRAFSVIDPKYFVGSKVENAGESWEQCKKYAPIAGLKEMGRFDMDMGRSTIDYITAREYTGFREKAAGFLTDSDYRDEIIGKAPELADQITWCAMWEAAKRQTAAKNPRLSGEALLTQAGKLFTECITRTQVYDSVFSRSANMRSKDTGMAMVTSFMAEPTTSINMIENAVRQWSRGYKMNAAKAVTSVLASVVINSALVSLVYAARNKDEDKTYWEKYLASLTGELMEGVNPITYIPYARDVWNMLQGYDVERSDMSLAADAVKALNKIVKVASKYPADGNEEQQQAWLKSLGDACWTGADGVASILGIPEKNIRRDIVAVMNLFKDSNWGESDSGTIKDAIAEAVKDATPIWNQIPDESRETKLYKAIIGGTPAQLHRLQNKYNTPKELENAVVKALRLKDPRILQAAEAHAAGDDQTRLRIAKELIAEKHFTQNQVVAAINAEVSRINSEGKTASDKIKEQSLYYTEDYIDAMTAGLGNTDAIRQEIIRAKVANSDKEQEEAIASAEKSFMYAVKDTAKDQFLDGDLSMEQTEKILKSVGVYDGDEEDIHRNVYAWQISEELGGKYDWSVSQYLDWKEVIAPSGFFTPDTYDNYLTGVGNVHGEDLNGDGKTDKYSKTKAMARYINSLPLTNEQKDFLFALEYPNINTQKKYKLW